MRKIFLFLLAILILPFVLAYPVAIQLSGNMNFNSAVYHCNDASCSSMSSYTLASGNPVQYTIGNTGSGMQYFAEYDYVSDRCYVSHSYKNWFDESTGNGPWQYAIAFTKQGNCQASINSILFQQQIYDNQTQQITANIKSPLNLNAAGPLTVPAALQYYYSTNVAAIIEIRNQTNSLVYTQTLSQDISWSTSKDFAFSLPLLQASNYTITIKTQINDCMCSSYIEQSQTGTFAVLPQPTPSQPNQAPVANFTYTPQNPLVNQLITFDANSSYDADGSIISYSWYFSDGANAAGITVQHTFTAAGNYSVALTVTDDDNAQSAIVRIIQILPQPTPPQPPQNQTSQTSSKVKRRGSVDNIDINDLIKTKEFCSQKGKITIGFYNAGSKLNDVHINFKIPKLSISIDSEDFDIAKRETKYIEFEFVSSRTGTYQSIISIYHKGTNKRLFNDIMIKCKPASEALPASASLTATSAATTAQQTERGITGNVIAVALRANAWGIIALLFILVLIEVIVLFFRFMK